MSHCAHLVIAGALIMCPAYAGAQIVSDPRVVEFKPSELHASLTPDGRPFVARYDLEFYYPDAPQPFQVVSLGKPKPDPDGTIRATFIGVPFSWPSSGLTYVARVAAVGPAGAGRSDPSNEFLFSGRCNYALSQETQSFPSAGGAGAVTIHTAPGCAWTASSSATWALITNSSGSDTSVITYSVRASPTGASRSTTIRIAGQTLVVAQDESLPAVPSGPIPHAP